ncbi:MAG: hypothetical protein EOO08_03795 [Chitinophagaceae bacterium]|nr:MAG: hypothetical protein EOO08_03795 [Chitinophagaceae bacterium]
MQAHQNFSRICLFIAAAWMLLAGLFYYPKWQKPGSESTLSWDVNGYYSYLPAALIYRDLRGLGYRDSINRKYQPASSNYEAFRDSASGNYVMKYASGMSFAYLPFFAVGHSIAKVGGWPADGYSAPYQAAIGIGSLLVSLLALFLFHRLLRRYFAPVPTGILILLYVFGTNYLEYAAITNAMTHGYLFEMYCALLLCTIRYYESPTLKRAMGIGALVGWMALIRPTEVAVLLLVLGWGVGSRTALAERFRFFAARPGQLAGAAVAMLLVGTIQLIYWKYVTGHWLVYSYQEEGFHFTHPHFDDCLWSFRKGWLLYTPLMILALIGFGALWRKSRALFWPTLLYTFLFCYIAFSWSTWWYGGGLGQRALIQIYPVVAFPFAALLERAHRRWMQAAIGVFAVVCVYYNLWLHHQAHRGGLLEPEYMTYAYWKKILFRYEVPDDARKLLDADYEFNGTPACAETVFQRDTVEIQPGTEFTSITKVLPAPGKAWVRVYVTAATPDREWDLWKYHQLCMQDWKGGVVAGANQMRIERLLANGGPRTMWLDLKRKDERDSVEVYIYNPGSSKPLLLTGVKIIAF